MNKKNTLLLLVCGTLFAPSVQAAQGGPNERERNQRREQFLQGLQHYSTYCNAVAAPEVIDSAVRGVRISKMVNTEEKSTIRNMAIANMITSSIIIGTKLWFGGIKNIQVLPNALDLFQAYNVATNAELIAQNNALRSRKSKRKLANDNAVLGTLIAESCTSFLGRILSGSHFFVDGYERRQNTNYAHHQGRAIPTEITTTTRQGSVEIPLALPIQLVSFILWIIRYRKENKLITKLMEKPIDEGELDNEEYFVEEDM